MTAVFTVPNVSNSSLDSPTQQPSKRLVRIGPKRLTPQFPQIQATLLILQPFRRGILK